jgi:putative FmdB family regulatory protein
MPTYQYACTSCGERLEAVQKFSDDPLTECPACAGTLRKVFSAVGVVFKGSGFYKTDSRSRSASKSGASSSSSSSADASTSDSSAATSSGGSSEAAPAASGSGGEKKSDDTDKVA